MEEQHCLKFVFFFEKQKMKVRSGTDMIPKGQLKVFEQESEAVLFEIQQLYAIQHKGETEISDRGYEVANLESQLRNKTYLN